MNKPFVDDGRRRMPKSWCPYCRKRCVDSRTTELHNLIELVPLSDNTADYFIVCNHCGKTVGVKLKIAHDIPRAELRAY